MVAACEQTFEAPANKRGVVMERGDDFDRRILKWRPGSNFHSAWCRKRNTAAKHATPQPAPWASACFPVAGLPAASTTESAPRPNPRQIPCTSRRTQRGTYRVTFSDPQSTHQPTTSRGQHRGLEQCTRHAAAAVTACGNTSRPMGPQPMTTAVSPVHTFAFREHARAARRQAACPTSAAAAVIVTRSAPRASVLSMTMRAGRRGTARHDVMRRARRIFPALRLSESTIQARNLQR